MAREEEKNLLFSFSWIFREKTPKEIELLPRLSILLVDFLDSTVLDFLLRRPLHIKIAQNF